MIHITGVNEEYTNKEVRRLICEDLSHEMADAVRWAQTHAIDEIIREGHTEEDTDYICATLCDKLEDVHWQTLTDDENYIAYQSIMVCYPRNQRRGTIFKHHIRLAELIGLDDLYYYEDTDNWDALCFEDTDFLF